MKYRKTQFGSWTLLILLLVGVLMVPLVRSTYADGQTIVAILIVLLYVLILALFYALTVEVSAGCLTFWFGIGLIRKTHPLEEIQSMTIVQNPWYYLWGIKSIPGGWLYAIGPGPALEITLKSGQMFQIGTKDTQALKRAINHANYANFSHLPKPNNSSN